MTLNSVAANGWTRPNSIPISHGIGFKATSGAHSILRALYRGVRVSPAGDSLVRSNMEEARRQACRTKGSE